MFKKYIKVFICILTSCIVLFNYTCNCYAVSSNVTVESWMQQLGDAIRTITITLEAGEHLTSNALREYVKKSFDSVGFMIDETGVLLDKIKTAIHGVDNNFDDQTSDEDDIGQWIVDNTEVINGDVVFGDKYNAFIKEYNENYVEESTGKIAYCLSLQQSQASFSSEDLTLFSGLINDYPSFYWYRINDTSSTGNQWFFGLNPEDGWIYGVVQQNMSSQYSNYIRLTYYKAYYINGILHCERWVSNDSNDSLMYGKYRNESSFTNKTSLFTWPWNPVVNGSGAGASSFCNAVFGKEKDLPIISTDFTYTGGFPASLSTNNKEILYFDTENALQTYINTYGIGKQSYYYNNEVWSNFVDNSSGDYTVTTSNVNTVTYGDTISYINDSHDVNNNYPDNSTVNNWIETTNNNNNSGGSGGGSGGSGDDSGGSGDDSGGSGIVSILTALGKAIADLITGIAAFLAEVVGGLVEAITGLLDTLTDLISNFTESIPNIFSPLLGWLFDGLPEEFIAIILLGLTACVIASIIKILRG